MMYATEEREIGRIRAYVEARQETGADRRAWMIAHYEQRLEELSARRAGKEHPEILRRYEEDIRTLRAELEGQTWTEQ